MSEYGPSTFGDRFARVYDDWFRPGDPDEADRLADLAGGGRALELAIGTGRIALPLKERGVDGVFVLEAFVPNLGIFDEGRRVSAARVETDRVVLEVSRHDATQQRVDTTMVELSSDGVGTYPLRVRYCWPSELDLMARLAGLRLRARWAGWNEEPFTSSSGMHVSVYERG